MTCAPSPFVPDKNPGGRPRVHDREKIAKDLIEWAKRDDSLNLNGFCCSREPPLSPRKLSEWSHECSMFQEAYETAKAFIGDRRERKLSKNELHVKAYDLNAAVYDYYLKEEKREQAKYEAQLSKETAMAVPEAVIQINEKLRQELSEARQSLSDRKRADTTIINESKS